MMEAIFTILGNVLVKVTHLLQDLFLIKGSVSNKYVLIMSQMFVYFRKNNFF